MSPEERHTLCKILRTMEPWPCKQAADELERLEAEVARLKDENGVLMEKMTNMLDMTVR